MVYLKKIIAAFGVVISCWGFISPEYCFMSETITVIEQETGEEVPFETNTHFIDFINANSSQIKIRSKLWELVSKREME